MFYSCANCCLRVQFGGTPSYPGQQRRTTRNPCAIRVTRLRECHTDGDYAYQAYAIHALATVDRKWQRVNSKYVPSAVALTWNQPSTTLRACHYSLLSNVGVAFSLILVSFTGNSVGVTFTRNIGWDDGYANLECLRRDMQASIVASLLYHYAVITD